MPWCRIILPTFSDASSGILGIPQHSGNWHWSPTITIISTLKVFVYTLMKLPECANLSDTMGSSKKGSTSEIVASQDSELTVGATLEEERTGSLEFPRKMIVPGKDA